MKMNVWRDEGDDGVTGWQPIGEPLIRTTKNSGAQPETNKPAPGGQTGQKGMRNMKKYQLFGEWRGVAVYGNNLADALMRERTLRTPTQYAPKGPGWTAPVVVGGGEEWVVAGICDVFSPANSTRGGKPYLRALVKFADNRIREVDAVEVV